MIGVIGPMAADRARYGISADMTIAAAAGYRPARGPRNRRSPSCAAEVGVAGPDMVTYRYSGSAPTAMCPQVVRLPWARAHRARSVVRGRAVRAGAGRHRRRSLRGRL